MPRDEAAASDAMKRLKTPAARDTLVDLLLATGLTIDICDGFRKIENLPVNLGKTPALTLASVIHRILTSTEN